LGNTNYHEDLKKFAIRDRDHDKSLPNHYDLRQEYQNCITPVENQGQCGSCWSFSISGTVSDAWAVQNAKKNKTNKCDVFVQGSQEDLLWCSTATGSNWNSTTATRCEGGVLS
jgi:C1A family cysteine protease